MDIRKHVDEAVWTAAGVLAGLPRFVVLRLDELAHPETHEEQRPRVTNVRILVQELQAVAAFAQTRESARHQVSDLWDELMRAVDRERNCTIALPARDHPQLVMLDRAIRQPDFADAALIAGLWDLSLRSTYLTRVRDAFLAAIRAWRDAGSPLQWTKHPLAGLLEVWVTELLSLGHSYEFLQSHALSRLLDSSAGDWADRLTGLVTSLPLPEAEHRVSLVVRGLPSGTGADAHAGSMVLRDVRALRSPDDLGEAGRLLSPSPSEFVAEVTTRARDPWAAEVQARAEAEQALSFVQFARASKRHDVGTTSAVVSNGTWTKVERQTSTAFAHRPDQKAALDWWKVAARIVVEDGTEARGLASALRHHRLSCTASSTESSLLNLWIAFEALFPEADTSIIRRVADPASKMIAGAFLWNSLRSTLVDMAKRGDPGQLRATRAAIPVIRPQRPKQALRIDPEELLSVLCAPEEDQMKALLDAVSGNELLVHRLFDLWQDCRKPKSLGKRIERHQRTVAWQLRRIYRVRNIIAHDGKTPPMTAELVRHAQHYLSTVVMQLIHDLGHHNGLTLSGAVRQRTAGYDHVVAALLADKPLSYRALTEPWSWTDGLDSAPVWAVVAPTATAPTGGAPHRSAPASMPAPPTPTGAALHPTGSPPRPRRT